MSKNRKMSTEETSTSSDEKATSSEKENTPSYKPNKLMEIDLLLRSKVPIIYVVTHEEQRVRTLIREHILSDPKMKRELWTWSPHKGLIEDDKRALVDQNDNKSNVPRTALAMIRAAKVRSGYDGAIYLMNDLHTVLMEPLTRQLKDLAIYLQLEQPKIPGEKTPHKTIIITAPELGYSASPRGGGLPMTLEKEVAVVDFDLPSKAEIKEQVKLSIGHFRDLMKIKVESTKGNNKKFWQEKLNGIDSIYTSDVLLENTARKLQGLTANEINNALSISIIKTAGIDQQVLQKQKRQLIMKAGILELVDDIPQMNEVGGLDEAKNFLQKYAKSFTPEAVKFGAEPLRAVLFAGIPGTGKSLTAKALGAAWELPVLRLDVGKVMSGLVGASEERMRQAIKSAESMAPAILWIDEVEKSLSGTGSSNFSDGGTIARVFGTLLTAMQERLHNITIFATANDIQALPPEFIRRFNEVFFVDLPTEIEREEVFNIHLKKRKRDPTKFNMKALINASNDYTPSEIEKSIKEGITAAFYADKEDVTTEDIITALNGTKPISQVMGEKIREIRNWARDRARYASSLAREKNESDVVKTKETANDVINEIGNLIAEDNTQKEQQSQETSVGGPDLDL